MGGGRRRVRPSWSRQEPCRCHSGAGLAPGRHPTAVPGQDLRGRNQPLLGPSPAGVCQRHRPGFLAIGSVGCPHPLRGGRASAPRGTRSRPRLPIACPPLLRPAERQVLSTWAVPLTHQGSGTNCRWLSAPWAPPGQERVLLAAPGPVGRPPSSSAAPPKGRTASRAHHGERPQRLGAVPGPGNPIPLGGTSCRDH